ncbi:MAG TPA: hypothetical protein VFT64_03135 [Rickettsiales bacterium]|nr:hypothetical protein [Rickettsiales bacterium]
MNKISRLRYGVIGAVSLLAASALSTQAQAAVTDKDMKVVAKAISFVENGPKGTVDVAVVTDGGASKADADAAVSQAAGAGLTATIVAPAALSGTAAKVVFIPAGMNGSFDAIFSAASAKKLITISNSGDCTAAQKCAISVKSEPAVDITVSKAASAATGVSFGSAFSMMIKEVP